VGSPGITLADLIEDQVARTPSAVAVVGRTGSLTYADLDDRANRLAHHLQALGVGPEVVVGVCAGRSLEMAVGLLGVLKAGGACLPLDPLYPSERLALMLTDSQAKVVLTVAALADRLPRHQARTVRLDADWPAVAGQPHLPPPRSVTPDNLAYVIYTSGSTGVPKGVMLAHGSLVHHNRVISRVFGLEPADRVLQFCSLSFDVSFEEMFPSWASGATVVLRADELPVLGGEWLEWLREQEITVLNLPTVHWHEWARDLQSRGESVPPAVRLVVVGGEKVLGSAYRTWMAVGGDRPRWMNGYGPAEASVTATVNEPGPDAASDGRDPSIGRPVEGTTVHLLDEQGNPVGDGVAGEVYVGGEGLARGYLRRPDLTAERFVPDPFGGRPGARLYRTGDVGRWLPGGDIEYLGRVDHQLKVRGFRIESGEVEAALVGHPAISEAVVVAREDTPGDKRLVAYVVTGDGDGSAGRPTPGDLRRFLAGRLPPFMVPSAFVRLEALPTTPNGKVDRAGLPAPVPTRPDLSTPWAAPRTPTERALVTIWSEVLGIGDIGVDDDFFELGGHSLLATQVVARAREAYAGEIPLSAMFERPTVAGLAAVIDARVAGLAAVPPLLPQPRSPGMRFPLSLAQEQMLGLELAAEPAGLYNVTALHRFSEPVDVGVLRAALGYMAERHESLRTAFRSESGQAYQVVEPAAAAELTVRALSGEAPATAEEREAELRRIVAEHDSQPFDVAVAPLFRAQLVVVATDDSRLVVTFDHLVCDLTSAYVFLWEVTTAYEALADDRVPELSPLPVQYADFAAWQRQWLTEDRLAAQYQYWRKVLTGMPMGPAIPFDRVPATPTRRIARHPVTVPPEVYTPLQRLARSTRATPFVVCVAAVKALLSRAGGLTDIVLSTTLSGRSHNEVDGVIGMFAGVGRMRTDLSGDPPFLDLVARVRETVLGLFEHQDIPFMRVRDALFPDFPKQQDYARTAAVIPVELLYFHAAHDHWAPGSGVVERPGGEDPVDDLFFRGQLQPLSLTFVDDGREMWAHFSYKLDFFDEATIERLATGLERLLRAVGDDPGLRLSELPVGFPRAPS